MGARRLPSNGSYALFWRPVVRLLRSIPLALVIACGPASLLVRTDVAGAQPVADTRAAARQHFQAGVAALGNSDFATALTEFQAAQSLAPNPLVLVNIAH